MRRGLVPSATSRTVTPVIASSVVVAPDPNLFANAFSTWLAKPMVAALRGRIRDEFPDADLDPIRVNQFAVQFLTFEMLRYIIPTGDDEDKEPWQM